MDIVLHWPACDYQPDNHDHLLQVICIFWGKSDNSNSVRFCVMVCTKISLVISGMVIRLDDGLTCLSNMVRHILARQADLLSSLRWEFIQRFCECNFSKLLQTEKKQKKCSPFPIVIYTSLSKWSSTNKSLQCILPKDLNLKGSGLSDQNENNSLHLCTEVCTGSAYSYRPFKTI